MNQSTFIAHLKDITGIKKDSEIKHLIARVLNISLSGAYKKMQGITQLSINEANEILDYLNHKMEIKRVLPNHSFTYSFYSDDIVRPPRSYEQWAANILNHSQDLDRLRKTYTLYSFQNEISYFHYLAFKPLLHFKLFVWNRSNWNIPGPSYYSSESFRNNLALNLLIDRLTQHYQSYKSIEIWNYDFLDPLLHQISYYYKMGAIPEKEDLNDLVKSVYKLISTLERTCEVGRKVSIGKKDALEPIEVYLNQTMTNSNIIFIEAENYQLTYGAFLDPNFLRTNDKHISQATSEWIKRSIKQSTLISGSGEQARSQYFVHLKEKVQTFEAHL